MRKRSKKQFCFNGHDLFIIGKDKQGHCNQCRRDYDKARHTRQNRTQFCPKGHDKDILGRTGHGRCKECARLRRIANKKEKAIYDKIYLGLNRDKILKRGKEYYATHRETSLEQSKQYAIDHPEVARRAKLKNKINRKSRIPKFGQKGIKEFYDNCPIDMVVDHIIPLCGKKISGLHVIWNMQYLTPKQNSKKGNKWDGTLKNRGWGNK
jgi:5-methylcytosine-specific restriction endonuclease McrA